MAIVSGGGGGGFAKPSSWTIGPYGELTIQPGTNSFTPVLTLIGPPGSRADGDELFSIKDDGPVQRFGVDALGGIGFAMVSTPFNAGVGFSRDAGGDIVTLQAGSGAMSAWSSASGFANRTIQSGALPTVAPVSGTAFQCSTSRDVFLAVPFTGDATNNAATLKIELSPNDVTYTTLDTLSIAAALNLTGAINIPVTVAVPINYYVKLTATHGTIGTATYY